MDIDTYSSRYVSTIALRLVDKQVFLFPIVIVLASSPPGILESKISSGDDVHMISVISSLLRPIVYSSTVGSSGSSSSTDDGAHV